MKKVIIKGRWDEPITHEWEGSLISTLRTINEYTLDNDMPGYFFAIEDADQEYVKQMNLPIFMNGYGVLLAPNDYTIIETYQD